MQNIFIKIHFNSYVSAMAKILQFKRSLNYYLKLLDTRLEQGDYLGALDAIRNAIESSKLRIDRLSLNLILSEIYFKMGLYNLSCEYAFLSVKIPETRASAYLNIGKNLVKLGRPKLALKYLSEALNWDSSQNLVGAILEWSNEIKKDLMNNNYKLSTIDIIKSLIRQKRYDEAIELIYPYLQNGDIRYQIMYCDILVQVGDFNTARTILFNILKFDNENIDANLVLCSLCLAEKDFLSLSENVVKLNDLSLNEKELELLGNIQAKSEDYTGAIETYQKILKRSEFNTKILLFISICYFNVGNIKEALYYIGRARWIDIDNPTLNIFYQIMNGNMLKFMPVSTAVPYEVGQEKIDKMIETSMLSNFDEIFDTSLTLAGDIEWGLTLKNADFMQKIVQILAKSNKKEIVNFYQKLLLTMRIGARQKYFLTKYALLEGKRKSIDLTCGFYYKSFSLKIPNSIKNNDILRSGYCGAVSYAEINNLKIDFDYIALKLSSKNLGSIDYSLTENLVSCLFFTENNQILEQACIYFDTPQNDVFEAIKYLKLQ